MNKSVDPSYAVEVIRDIPYGDAFVDYREGRGPFRARKLLLDAYVPVGAPGQRAALVLAFGGAFHRGSKEDDVRADETPRNTNTAAYAERFAARGYVCFSIDYRLTQEDPHPGFTPTMGPEPVPTSRIDVVRKILNLPPASSDMLKWAQEAAIDDIACAYRFVVGEAACFQLDPTRVAIGGYSAGGRIAVTAALAEAISPAAVVALSGVAAASIVDAFHASGRRKMPMFIAYGEHDLDYVGPGALAMAQRFTAARQSHQICMLPGQSHFYSAESEFADADGTMSTLETAMAQFLARNLSVESNP
jgi:acetyl esterase/lipase